MKKLIALLLAVVLMLSLAACKKTCKAEDCDNEATQEGYCDVHFAIQQAKEGLNQLGEAGKSFIEALG